MKFLNKIMILAVVFFFASCQDFAELDFLDDPNAVSPENASIEDLYNNIQLEFEQFLGGQTVGNGDYDFDGLWQTTSGLARMRAEGGAYNYQSTSTPNEWNFEWTVAYARIFPDVDALIPLATERGLDVHVASAKVIKAYIMTTLVDLFGDVPYSEAGQGTDIISPQADAGADVYAAANTLLEEAIASLSSTTATGSATDLFYGGSASGWLKAASTMRLRNAVNTRLVDGTSASTINSLIAAGNLISDTGDDFQFNYGSQRSNPNSRHPLYLRHYESRDGDYMSNYYMWLLAEEKGMADPRLRYYFYRQIEDSEALDINEYSCHFSNTPDQNLKPAHYEAVDPNLPYCYGATNGYFGRDHLNAEGIPPDGQLRTVYGLYPMGGQFDDESFSSGMPQSLGTTGGLGQGIQPLMLASFADFIQAEAALTLGTNGDARALLESGMRKSIAKVISFGSLVSSTLNRSIDIRGGGTSTVGAEFVPTADDIEAYVALVLSNYDAAGDDRSRLDVVMKEYYIAMWGNGIEGYNMWRRTGLPSNMAPALEPSPGGFIRSFFYPFDYVVRNGNASQKEISVPVFWDNNPAGFAY